jgi:integrase
MRISKGKAKGLAKSSKTTLVELPDLLEAARGYVESARARSTRERYSKAWRSFLAWCRGAAVEALPADNTGVAVYLAHLAKEGKRVATIHVALVAIGEAHRRAGFDPPHRSAVVRETMKGIRRTVGTAPRRVAPALADNIRAMLSELPDSPIGLRDRALLSIGFAGAFRRSELVALDVKHLEFSTEGLRIDVARSKTDQEGKGTKIGIPYGRNPLTCPVTALRDWLRAARITSGPVFRSVNRHGHIGGRLTGAAVARIVKRSAESAGLDPTQYSGHSLRSGLATSAAHAGANDRSIMKQGRWSSRTMVDRYVRDATLFRDNAASGLL